MTATALRHLFIVAVSSAFFSCATQQSALTTADLAGSWRGNVSNTTHKLVSHGEMSIHKVDSETGNFTGMVLLTDPLMGSGEVRGIISGSSVNFTVTPSVKGLKAYSGTGKVRGNKIVGKYEIHHLISVEKGKFTLSRSHGSVDSKKDKDRLALRSEEERERYKALFNNQNRGRIVSSPVIINSTPPVIQGGADWNKRYLEQQRMMNETHRTLNQGSNPYGNTYGIYNQGGSRVGTLKPQNGYNF